MIQKFMQDYSIPGGTVAITKDGRLIYNRAFGYADAAHNEPTQPYHIFRIASNSKAITSIAVMKLIEGGQLGLNDTVFGANRILTQPYYLNAITDNRIYSITVKQLLEHTAGWDRDINCDGYSGCDPIGFPTHVASVLGEANPVGDSSMIKFLLQKGLNYAPGATYAYSNVGYLILGKVIEKKTGMKYEAYVSSVIMQPLGLCDMHLGKNLLADKQEREGEYIAAATTVSCYGTGQQVPWQYGGFNLEAMNAHGQWISSSEDYVRMILAVDGFSTVPDILSPASIITMTTPSSANAGYAKGWSVNQYNNWWHTGALDGTSTFMARTAGGYTWAFHFNSRSNNSNAYWSALDALPWNCLAATATFPSYNLFAPSQQAGALAVSKTGATTVHLSWTNGNGNTRLVVAREAAGWKRFPVAGTDYTASSTYGSGQDVGNNTYVVYNGTGTTVDVSGLDPAKTYYFSIFEGTKSAATGNYSVYKYGCRPSASINMMATAVESVQGQGMLQASPNPVTGGILTIENNRNSLTGQAAILTDITGRTLQTIRIGYGSQRVDVSMLASGVYFLRLADGSALKILKQ